MTLFRRLFNALARRPKPVSDVPPVVYRNSGEGAHLSDAIVALHNASALAKAFGYREHSAAYLMAASRLERRKIERVGGAGDTHADEASRLLHYAAEMFYWRGDTERQEVFIRAADRVRHDPFGQANSVQPKGKPEP